MTEQQKPAEQQEEPCRGCRLVFLYAKGSTAWVDPECPLHGYKAMGRWLGENPLPKPPRTPA